MPKTVKEYCEIINKTELALGFYRFTLKSEEICKLAHAGQFVHILCEGFTLRRPISLCEIEKDSFRIVFEVRGQGTRWMSELPEGYLLDILGPIGRGFEYSSDNRILLVGGGVGVPPLLEIANSARCDSVLGFRSLDAAILYDEFSFACQNAVVATADGTLGVKGFVSDPVSELLDKNNYDLICACGPMPMLKAVAHMANKKNIKCLVSLEERMACGVGACLGCASKIKKHNHEHFGHVCKDGPVFDSKEVVWE